jgi:hypothetical protein
VPTYTNTPPANPRGVALPVKRVQPGKTTVTVATSDDLIGTKTHFFGGRTIPCETPVCKACLEGIPWRWHAYLGCYDPPTGDQWILELTAAATARLLEYRSAYGTLRGAKLKAHRANWAKNSRLVIEATPADLARITLPPAPNLKRCLAILWNLPEPALHDTGQGGLADAVETLSDVADTSRCLPIGPYAEAAANRLQDAPSHGRCEEAF